MKAFTYRTPKLLLAVLLAVLLLALLLPLMAFAQSDDLRATIRAELLKDPRASHMSQTDIDAMVNLLSQGAAAQGMTPYDITWRPAATPAQTASQSSSNPFCTGLPEFVCAVDSGFGFDGSNTIIPIGLFFTSGLLLFLLYELKHHHRHDAAMAAAGRTAQVQ